MHSGRVQGHAVVENHRVEGCMGSQRLSYKWWEVTWVGGVSHFGAVLCCCSKLCGCPVEAARHAALGLATHAEEAVGAGSCRCLSNWIETGPRRLGEFPSACQAAKSEAGGPSGLSCQQCAGKRFGDELPVRGMEHPGLPTVPKFLG